MNHIEGNFKGVRGTSIFYQGWLPEGEVKAVLFLVHGLGEHSGRYMNVVDHFVPLGYAIYGLDHIGHGKSGGERELVERFDDYTNTLTTYYNMVKEWQPDAPFFILGHSMGGLITSYYLLENQEKFQGAVISAPAVAIGESVSPVTITISKILSKILPKMGVLGLDVNAVSSDPEVVSAYINDPLVFDGKTPARLAAEMLGGIMRVNEAAGAIKLPLIIVQGSADQLVDPAGAQTLYDQVSSTDKTLKIYDGFYHEVFNEPGRAQVLADVENWLAAQLG